MTDEKTEVTEADLQARVARLTAQVAEDAKGIAGVDEAVKRAMKSGALDEVLAATDKRAALLATATKSKSQLKTAQNAIKSAQYAANAEKIASIHNDLRDGKVNVPQAFSQLEKLGVDLVSIDRSEETGKLIINSSGPAVKRSRASGGGGGGGKGQSLVVDGETFASASAALQQHRPDFTGKIGRAAIISWLVNNGHEVA